jgi:hypothetical protein
MSAAGQTQSFGDVGSMSGLRESGNGWAHAQNQASPARFALRKIGSRLRTGEPGPSRCAILIYQGRRHVRGRPPSPRFRTIQVCPKDLDSAPR